LWSGEGLFIGIFEAQNLGGGKILPPPDLKPGGRSPLLPPVSYAYDATYKHPYKWHTGKRNNAVI